MEALPREGCSGVKVIISNIVEESVSSNRKSTFIVELFKFRTKLYLFLNFLKLYRFFEVKSFFLALPLKNEIRTMNEVKIFYTNILQCSIVQSWIYFILFFLSFSVGAADPITNHDTNYYILYTNLQKHYFLLE